MTLISAIESVIDSFSLNRFIVSRLFENLPLKGQRGSEIWTCLDFEWSKSDWVANGRDFEWDRKYGSLDHSK